MYFPNFMAAILKNGRHFLFHEKLEVAPALKSVGMTPAMFVPNFMLLSGL
jgi:hypothetical protein